ncbi:hypothetical protein RchiOBHm_Chr5g0032471 [Rosa chinensis]|uniref:Non-specific serine/threonine protein kinase n=1 Tax=Rosa chinensis TaxID=74649 RepID=A0A2P6QAE9_ROSCH|nr:hypothetical protein RchiOBHm_Chr5g0032471 [Rosa chinensis]
MAVKNTFRLSLKQFQLLLLLLLLLPFSATPLTFNFPSFPLNVTANISMEGDALPDGSLRLTKSAVDVQKNQASAEPPIANPSSSAKTPPENSLILHQVSRSPLTPAAAPNSVMGWPSS